MNNAGVKRGKATVSGVIPINTIHQFAHVKIRMKDSWSAKGGTNQRQ